MYECVSGGSITYADEQTYKAITEGYCVPTCELDVGSIQCTFEGRFMDSYIYEYDLPHSPFTVITGVDFKHRDKMTARQPIANAEDASAQNAYISQTAGASSAYRIQDLDRSASLLQSGSGIASTACSESDTLLCGCQAIERSEESRLEDVSFLIDSSILIVGYGFSSFVNRSSVTPSVRRRLVIRPVNRVRASGQWARSASGVPV